MPRISSPFRHEPDEAHRRQASLDGRVMSLEATVGAMQQTLDVQFKRIAAMQAVIDHLTVSGKHDDNS